MNSKRYEFVVGDVVIDDASKKYYVITEGSSQDFTCRGVEVLDLEIMTERSLSIAILTESLRLIRRVSGFKNGDKVRVARKVSPDNVRGAPYWEEDMDSYVGDVGVVSQQQYAPGSYVSVDFAKRNDWWNFHQNSLELAGSSVGVEEVEESSSDSDAYLLLGGRCDLDEIAVLGVFTTRVSLQGALGLKEGVVVHPSSSLRKLARLLGATSECLQEKMQLMYLNGIEVGYGSDGVTLRAETERGPCRFWVKMEHVRQGGDVNVLTNLLHVLG